MDPKVSIILTSYNQKQRLKKAFESLLNQTYKNLEIIIVDDYSQDGSKEYILSLKEKYPNLVSYFFQPQNVGIPKNKNTGFKLASGELVTYLDGDDCYLPNKIEQEVSYLQENPIVDVVYSNFHFFNEDTGLNLIWEDKSGKRKDFNLFPRIITVSFPHGIAYRCEMWKKKVLASIDYYDESLPAFHDWDSRIRYSKVFPVGSCSNFGSEYRVNSMGISKISSKSGLHLEVKRVLNKNYHLLEDLSLFQRIFIKRRLNRMIRKQDLYDRFSSNAFQKAFEYLKFLCLYPEELPHFYWMVRSMHLKKYLR